MSKKYRSVACGGVFFREPSTDLVIMRVNERIESALKQWREKNPRSVPSIRVSFDRVSGSKEIGLTVIASSRRKARP